MERSFVQYQSLRGENVVTGGTSVMPGDDDHCSRLVLNIRARVVTNVHDEYAPGEEMDLALALTPRQVAQIVWEFFSDSAFGEGTIYHTFLRRLMTKRWALMTHPSYKDARNADLPKFSDLQYHRDERAVRPRVRAA